MKYESIYVAVDGSELSSAAVRWATLVATNDRARVCASHVYAAALHEQRFKMMEGGLPDEYQKENVLKHQRQVHGSLITRGLELITDSYLEATETTCSRQGIPFSGRSLEGRNWQELVKDITSGDYDLIALGANGVGRVNGSLLGTVAERVIRRVRRDVLIAKSDVEEIKSDSILVCLDGSSQSWGALQRGIALAKAFRKKLVAVSCFDPYFHSTVFHAVTNVLSDKAKEVFKFEEQEKLHDRIIDSGLAKVYQSHLDVAERIGVEEGIEISTQLLAGKAFARILELIKEISPWLVIMGRVGIHGDEDLDIGGSTENICRLTDCSVLVVETKHTPPAERLTGTA